MVWRQQGPKAWKLNPSKRPRSGPPVEGAGVGPVRRAQMVARTPPLPSKNKSGVNKPEPKGRTTWERRTSALPRTGRAEAGVRPKAWKSKLVHLEEGLEYFPSRISNFNFQAFGHRLCDHLAPVYSPLIYFC